MKLYDRIIANNSIDMDFEESPEEMKELLEALKNQEKYNKIIEFVKNYKVPSHGYPWHNKLKEILEL